MIKLLLACLLAVAQSFVSAQVTEEKLLEYVNQNAIDSFMTYRMPCSGYIIWDSCQYHTPQFLFWKKNGNYYVKKFDYCKINDEVLLDTLNPFKYYIENRKLIDTDEIKPPTYFDVKIRKRCNDTVSVTSFVSHSCYHIFLASIDKKLTEKSADQYFLQFEEFDNGRSNIYYVANRASSFNRLIDFTTTFLTHLTNDQK